MRPVLRCALGGALTFSLLAALWVGMFELQLGKPTRLGLFLHELVQFKQDALRAYHAPRVIVAGGSNVTYSLSTELLSDYTPDRAFNFGTHAGFNLDYLLDLVAHEARAGDTVVLALEYQHFGYDGKNSSVQVDYICGYNPEYLEQMTLLERAKLIFSFNFFGLTEPSLSLLQRALHLSKADQPIRRGRDVPYLNTHGDSINATLSRRTKTDMDNVLKDHPANLALDGREASWAILSGFLESMRARDVRVFHAWPVTRDFPYYTQPEAQKAFARIEGFFHDHGVPTLGRPEHFMFPPEDFYDTVYHLVRERQRVPTRILGIALKDEMKPDR